MALLLRNLILVLFALLSLSLLAQSDDCVYTMFISTGSNIKGGTNAKISLSLGTKDGDIVDIPNLEEGGGLMDKDHDYFERGNLDIFSVRGPCFDTPICAMNLTSDGTGENHGWFCEYVEVTSAGSQVPCKQHLFTVEQWLATDVEPNQLTATRNNCTAGDDKSQSSRKL